MSVDRRPPANQILSGANQLTPGPVPWRLASWWLAPHRMAFAQAVVVLVMASLWWAVRQAVTHWGQIPWPLSVPPLVLHGAVMVMGFCPLFFAGFLFTAGPKWLSLPPVVAAQLAPALLAQPVGWAIWLFGGHLHAAIAAFGVAIVGAALVVQATRFSRLVRSSLVDDRLHARLIALGQWLLAVAVCALAVLVAVGAMDKARWVVLETFWLSIVLTFVVVAHRMIPFFTSSALPMVRLWRPLWVLWLLLAVVGIEAVAVAVAQLWWPVPSGWRIALALAEGLAGAGLLWLAVAWGLAQSLTVRLLAMLHLGFVWLGVGLLLSGALRIWMLRSPVDGVPLASLHVFAMGFVGSLMMAMVTRVSCGHGGRHLVADDGVWAFFWLLQAGVLVRVAAAWPDAAPGWTALAALLWLAATTPWALRLWGWYGRPRADGRPG